MRSSFLRGVTWEGGAPLPFSSSSDGLTRDSSRIRWTELKRHIGLASKGRLKVKLLFGTWASDHSLPCPEFRPLCHHTKIPHWLVLLSSGVPTAESHFAWSRDRSGKKCCFMVGVGIGRIRKRKPGAPRENLTGRISMHTSTHINIH